MWMNRCKSAETQLKSDATTANRFDYVVLLMTAQRYAGGKRTIGNPGARS